MNYHGSIKMSPLLRGGTESTMEEVWLLFEERNQMLEELQFQLNRAQSCMKQEADKRRTQVAFEKGDFVFLNQSEVKCKVLWAF